MHLVLAFLQPGEEAGEAAKVSLRHAIDNQLALPIIEVAFGCYMALCIWISLWYQFGKGTIPFLIIFAGGYFYVGVTSIYVLWRMQREADAGIETEIAEAEPAEIIST